MFIGKIKQRLLKNTTFNWILSKAYFFNHNKSNYFLSNYEFNRKKFSLKSYPSLIYFNTTNLCNYKCKFCEIHYFYNFAIEKSGKLNPNNINIDYIQKFKRLFKRALSIELSGASGEPLLNPNFIEICRMLKKFKIGLTVTTNGSLLTESISKELIDMKFNFILVSLHSGEGNNYRELQGGDLNQIFKNLENLIRIRNIKNSKLPIISINCLLFKLNSHTIKELIRKVYEIGVDSININQYYASRNLIHEDASYYFDPEEGNKILNDIYQYSKEIGQNITPSTPNYINNFDIRYSNVCDQPWKNLKIKGAVEFENSHYIGNCNRIMLFRLNYKEFDGDFKRDIWNHELMIYFRKTVLKNPICKFCQEKDTPRLRCIDNREYQIRRDQGINQFFIDAYKNVEIKPRKGIYLLDKNPYEYVDYYDK